MSSLDKVKVTNSGYLRICQECGECKDTIADLPTENVEIGTIHFVRETEKNYQWTGAEWVEVGGEFEFSGGGSGGGSGGSVDVAETAINFVSSDSAEATEWTAVSVLTSGQKVKNVFADVSKMFKNIRYLYTTRSHVGMVIHSTTLDTEDKVKAIYGGTAWRKIEGRFLLGQSDEYGINTEGGEATHILTESEMPIHTHEFVGTEVSTGAESVNHSHSIPALSGTTKSGGGTHNHTATIETETSRVQKGSDYARISSTGNPVSGVVSVDSNGGAHTHDVITTESTTGKNTVAHTHKVTAKGTNKNAGEDGAHNNMPPYKTVYIWERTE